MSHYYFHTAAETVFRDLIGQTFQNETAARVEAVRLAGTLMIETPDEVVPAQDLRVEVTDIHNVIVFVILVMAIEKKNVLVRRT